ncbi:glycosyltransferase family 4 protein [Allopusillimonas ginsengisoli]|uniref:glycosyltransferase family 4 protein n=1 Tax=Allopusillimonas ginsengisoli TaxID=453575 RepID=UPI0010219CA6|nr:glycosyltransferase family 4 protein [Allopusillimonas ginsengisoli]TEA78388.1 glycosyltransferase family 1 protein [Allopusillimonas ginsengisoli]
MKVLITNMHNLNGGGHVTYIKSLAAGLQGPHEITVATPGTSRLYSQAQDIAGVRVIGRDFASRLSGAARGVANLRRLLCRERFDVVHVNGAADHRCVMLSRMGLEHPPPIVWTKHNTKPVGSFGNWLRARFGTDACIAVSDTVAGMLRDSPYGSGHIQVIRLGLDMRCFPPLMAHERQAAREAYFGKQHGNILVLGSVGGTDYEKGWLDLAFAVASLAPDLRSRVRIIVAGDPPPRTCLTALAKSGLQDQVLFPGLLRDIRPVLAASDVGFVLSYTEAASYASLEAMAAGLPTLVSNVGGLPEHVRDGLDGWVVPVGDVPAIAARIQLILDGGCDLAALGNSARRRVVDAFSVERVCRETESIYKAVMRNSDKSQIKER